MSKAFTAGTRLIFAALTSAALTTPAPADVGISVSVSQPGLYGQLNIGNLPPPPVIFAQPVVIERTPRYVSAPAVYLHVPPGHEKHWDKHCAEYNACGRPVYFVRDEWYKNVYEPRSRQGNDGNRESDNGGRGHGRGAKK